MKKFRKIFAMILSLSLLLSTVIAEPVEAKTVKKDTKRDVSTFEKYSINSDKVFGVQMKTTDVYKQTYTENSTAYNTALKNSINIFSSEASSVSSTYSNIISLANAQAKTETVYIPVKLFNEVRNENWASEYARALDSNDGKVHKHVQANAKACDDATACLKSIPAKGWIIRGSYIKNGLFGKPRKSKSYRFNITYSFVGAQVDAKSGSYIGILQSVEFRTYLNKKREAVVTTKRVEFGIGD